MLARRKPLLLAILLVVSLLVASCGQTPAPVERVVTQVVPQTVIVAGTPQIVEKQVTKVVEVEKTVAVTATPEVKAKEIVFMAGWGGEGKDALLKVIEPFTAKTGIQVRYEESRSLETLVRTRIAGGNPPDVVLETMPGAIAEWAMGGDLTPLDDPVGAEVFVRGDLDKIYPSGLLQLVNVGGIQYGFPFKADSKSLFFYDPREFTKLGLTVPKTWDELKAAADKCVAAGIAPFAVAGGADSWVLSDWLENILIRLMSAQDYNDLYIRHKIPWTDPRVKQGLTLMAELFSAKGYLAGGPEGALGITYGEMVADVFGTKPSAVMTMEGGFAAVTAMQEVNKSLVAGESIAQFMFPQIDPQFGDPVVGGADFIVLAKDTPEGRAFVQYLATKEAGDILASTDKIAPSRLVDPSKYANPLTREQYQQVINSTSFVFDGSDSAPSAFGNDFLMTKLQDLLAHPKEVDRIAQELEDYAKTLY